MNVSERAGFYKRFTANEVKPKDLNDALRLLLGERGGRSLQNRER